jgi:DNA mismatch endonuclease (patch repair protein)
MDHVSPQLRSQMMSRVKNANTQPELKVRKILHGLGFRFRLHGKKLPGRPDIVLPRWRTVVFVHGCFWHRHPGCSRASTPSCKVQFWRKKFDANVKRDEAARKQLDALGWRVLVVWQCELSQPRALSLRLARSIRAGRPPSDPAR